MPSPPIADLVRATLVPSDNFLAEMLLKGLGAGFGGGFGTTGAGAQVVELTLRPFGITPRIVDGSGLSRSNSTTPREVVKLFERMEDQEVARTWRRSLAVAGRSGTVATRMRRTPAAGRCHVKTGTINGVSNLAGVCDTHGGVVGFAWLMNGVEPLGRPEDPGPHDRGAGPLRRLSCLWPLARWQGAPSRGSLPGRSAYSKAGEGGRSGFRPFSDVEVHERAAIARLVHSTIERAESDCASSCHPHQPAVDA